ncbi:MAG: CooT family nickel-binding protein [Clostridiales bacterium]|nr:CooT family nickel-binding protein [Clostridiales bacterium]
MCLSSAYERTNGVDKLICEKITQVDVEDKAVRLTDLLGKQTLVSGFIKSIDLNKNAIYIVPAS